MRYKILIAVLYLALLAPIAHAQEAFTIDSFITDIAIRADSSIDVTETIVTNFTEPRHGIFRDIRAEGIEVEVRSVKDDQGNPLPYQLETWAYGPRIRIGDPNRTIIGLQTYSIAYDVKGGMTFFEDHDELYWNATGTEWPVPINEAKAVIRIPVSVNGVNPQLKCYTGFYGSEAEDCRSRYDSTTHTATFYANNPLPAQNGLTVVVGLPAGSVERPATLSVTGTVAGATVMLEGEKVCETDCVLNFVTPGAHTVAVKKFGYSVTLPQEIFLKPGGSGELSFILTATWWLKLLKLLLAALFILIALEPIFTYWKKGRDPRGRGVITPEYDSPDDLRPAEMGTLFDEKADLRDLSSTIVDLAVRGYLKIKVLPKALGLIFKEDDYELIKQERGKPGDPGLTAFEEEYMDALFGSGTTKKISALQNKFYTHLPDLKKRLYDSLVEKKYFSSSPETVRNRYLIKGIVVVFLSIFFLQAAEALLFQSTYTLAILANGVLTLIFANFMPAKTVVGVVAHEHAKGFRHYLEIAEKDRLKWQEKENIFYEFLPYAMTFGIADKWSKAFKDTFKQPPDWYVGGHGPFHPMAFTHDLGRFSTRMGSTLASRPSSSGSGGSGFSGGFSGGGGGGGGGGSW